MGRKLQSNSQTVLKKKYGLKKQSQTSVVPSGTPPVANLGLFAEFQAELDVLQADKLVKDRLVLNDIPTQIVNLEDTKAPWIDVIALEDAKVANDQALFNDIPAQILELEDTKAPWFDVIALEEAQVVSDQAVFNDIPAQIQDITDTKAAAVLSIVTADINPSGLVPVADASGSYDQAQVQELVDTVNLMKDVLVTASDLINEQKDKINSMNNF